MRDTVGSAAAPAASCKNVRRGSFILNPPSRFTSFDNLVGGNLQRQRYFEAECLGSLQIDDQLELGWLQNRQFGRLFTLENPTGVDTDVAISDAGIDSISNLPPGHRKF